MPLRPGRQGRGAACADPEANDGRFRQLPRMQRCDDFDLGFRLLLLLAISSASLFS